MVKVLENVFRGIICSFAVNNWSNLWRYWNQMFALIPPPYLCSSEEHQHGVPIVSPINFNCTFWRKTQQRKTAQTWDLARLLIYRYSIISEMLGFRHSKVLIFVFDGVIVKTMHHGQFTSQPSRSGNKKHLLVDYKLSNPKTLKFYYWRSSNLWRPSFGWHQVWIYLMAWVTVWLCAHWHALRGAQDFKTFVHFWDLTIINVGFWSASYSAYLVFTKTIILLRFGLKVDI